MLGAFPNISLVAAVDADGWLLEVPKLNPVCCGLSVPPKTLPLAAPDPPLLLPKRVEVWLAFPPPLEEFDVGAALPLPNNPRLLEAGGLLVDPNSVPP